MSMTIVITVNTPEELLEALAKDCDRRLGHLKNRAAGAATKRESTRLAGEIFAYDTFAEFLRTVKIEKPKA